MTNDAIQAIATVQERLRKRSDVSYWSNRLERTADYLVATPNRNGAPDKMVYNAQGSAGKVERNRCKRHAATPKRDLAEHLTVNGRYTCNHDVEHNVIAILDFIERVQLGDRERTVLRLLAEGKGVDAIAEHLGVSNDYAKTLICRTRHQAKVLWGAA